MENIISVIEDRIIEMRQSIRYEREDAERINQKCNERENKLFALQEELQRLKNNQYILDSATAH